MPGFNYKEAYYEADKKVLEVNILPEKYCNFDCIFCPIEGYSLEAYIDNMATFSKQYKGVFILEVTIIKGYNDDDRSIENMIAIIEKIAPTRIIVARIEDAPFEKKFGLTDESFNALALRLSSTFSGRE